MSLSSRFAGLSTDDTVIYPVTEALARWDGKYTQEAIDRVIEVQRKDWGSDHRSHGAGRIRPSSIGSVCPRPALLSFLGDPTDPESRSSRAIMDSGTWRHYYWQLVGLSAGFLTQIEVPLKHAKWRLSGSADGIGNTTGVFEFKSVNSQKFSAIRGNGDPRQFKPPKEHLDQVNSYLVAKDLHHASLVYEERNYLGWFEVRVERDEEVIASLDRRFAAWDAHIKAKTLPPILPDCWAQQGSVFKYCPWKESCFNRG